MSTVIQVRVDDELKKEVTELFNELGLDLSNAIRLFLRACVQRGGIPFEMKSKRTIEIEEAAVAAGMHTLRVSCMDHILQGNTTSSEFIRVLGYANE